MINTSFAEAPFLRDVAWQTTALLLAGGLGSLLWARQPARAHRLLLLTLLAAMITPLMTHAVRQLGMGFFARPEPALITSDTQTNGSGGTDSPRAIAASEIRLTVVSFQELEPLREGEATRGLALSRKGDQTAGQEFLSLTFLEAATEPIEPEKAAWFSLPAMVGWTWLILAGALIARLLASMVQGWRLLAGARPLAEAKLQEALDRATAKLGIRRTPEICTSDRITTPMIWCWRRRPIILLPVASVVRSPLSAAEENPSEVRQNGQRTTDDGQEVDWVGVLCHELAHWKRRDHLAGLAGEMAVAALPLQPLTWWAKRRLGQLCERACDDWVLASGQSPVHYAESLLALLPRDRAASAGDTRRSALACASGLTMTAVRSRRGLARRFQRILAQHRSSPALGKKWAVMTSMVTAAVCMVLALAQYRPVAATEPPRPAAQASLAEGKNPAGKDAKGDVTKDKTKPAAEVSITGKVLGVEDKPVADAQVAIIGWVKVASGRSRYTYYRRADAPALSYVLGQTKTDKNGRYQLTVPLQGPIEQHRLATVVSAKGYGIEWTAPTTAATVIHLQPEQVISGRLIDLQGQPAKGVKLQMTRIGNRPASAQGITSRLARTYLSTGKELVDSDGDEDDWYSGGIVAYDLVEHMAIAPPEVLIEGDMVAVMSDGSVKSKDGKKPPVIEHTPIQFVEPPEDLALWPQPVTTDDQGRFTICGVGPGQGVGLLIRDDRFAVQVLDIQPPSKEKPGALTLVLNPAHIVEGTVTETQSGKPLPGARVQLYPPDRYATFGFVEAGGRIESWAGADFKGRHQGGNGVLLALFVAGNEPVRDPLPPIQVKADDKGHFRINLPVGESYTLRALGPQGEQYLKQTKTINWPKGAARQQVDFSLPRGQRVQVKVTEAGSGKPVKSALIDFWSKGLKLPEGVDHPRPAQTAANGTLKAVLPPGSWYAVVNAASSDYLYQKIEAKKLTADQPVRADSGSGAEAGKTPYFYPDGWVAFEIQTSSKPDVLAVTLRRLPLKVRIIGPDGKPVAKARVLLSRELPPAEKSASVSNQASSQLAIKGDLLFRFSVPASSGGSALPETHSNQPVEDGSFEIPVHDPEATYRLLIADADHGLGAVAEFKGKQAESGPVTVRLEPCGSATARFVDAKGKLLANYRPYFWALLPPVHASPLSRPTDLSDVGPNGPQSGMCEIWMGQADPKLYGDGPRTDAQGKIRLPNLVPGAIYRISKFDGTAKDFLVKSGKNLDLGDIPVVKAEQTKKLPVIKPAK